MKRNLASMRTVVQEAKTPTFQFTMVQHNGTFFQATTQEKILCDWTIFKKLSNLFLLSQQLIEFRKKKSFFAEKEQKNFDIVVFDTKAIK